MNPAPADAFRLEVLAALGTAPEWIEPGRLHRFSVNGKPGDTSGWCHLFDDGRAGVYGDFRASLSAVWTAQQRERMTPAERAHLRQQMDQARAQRQQAQAQAWAQAQARNAQTWQGCQPIPADGTGNDPVSLYLRRRLALAAGEALHIPDCLRLHPALAYHHQGQRVSTWPAMVAAVTSPAGELVALHRTWLTADGHKAPTPGPVKKLTSASGPVMTGCIRLSWPTPSAQGLDLDPAGPVLGIAEGIETALSARQASGLGTVAAYSAGALAAWHWPQGLARLVIFADHDPAGQDAAQALRQRAQGAGLSVKTLTPTEPGQDWCDVWAHRHQPAPHARDRVDRVEVSA